MKEKIALFIALSFIVSLTIYKKSLNSNENLSHDVYISSNQLEITPTDTKNSNGSEDALYMDIDNDDCIGDHYSTDKLTFNEAFKYYRNCNYDIFKWNGIEYTTILKNEDSINNGDNKNGKHPFNDKLDLVIK